MRIVQLEGPAGGAPLVFHPSLTVVDGLDDEVRERLLAVFRALPAGIDPGWPGLVEAHGVVLDLDVENLRLLGMNQAVEVVVGRGDLPGAGGPTLSLTTGPDDRPVDPLAGLRMSHEILAHGVATLKRTRIEFEEARLQAVEALEEARGDLDPFATTAFEQAAARLRRADEDGAGGEGTPVPVAEDTTDLVAERDDVAARLDELDAIDVTPVVDALARAEAVMEGDGGLDADGVAALAEALAAAEADVARIDEARRADGRDPAEMIRRIESARLQLERLQSSAASPVLTAEDVAELEAAHDAVVDADSKVSASRIGGKAARQRLDEAIAVEAEVLARLGYPTYSSFALAQSAPGPDPETRVELEAARKELTDLEAAYDALVATEGQDLERAAAVARCEELRADAASLVDAAPTALAPALARLAEDLAGDDDRVRSVLDLRGHLRDCGVDFGDLELSDDEVLDVARAWLADTQELLDERPVLRQELDALDARLLLVDPALAEAGESADPRQRAQLEVEAAEARLARHRQASDRVAELCGLLEEVESRLRDLGENISAQEALVAAAAEGLAAAESVGGEPAVGAVDDLLVGQPEGMDDTEWYLLTRLAGLRSLSYAGSVPLVLDGALADLDREAAHRVLEQVATMTDVVQVVYLGGDEAVVEWAALRGPEASVVSVAAPVG